MGAKVRVFHDGAGAIKSREHRRDETYLPENVPASLASLAWVIKDISEFYDAAGEVPFEATSIRNGAVAVDAVKRDAMRQKAKDGTVGAGGRLDALRARLVAGTLTQPETIEMLRLERGL